MKLDDIYSKCSLNKGFVEETNLIKICETQDDKNKCLSDAKPLATTGGDFVVCGLTQNDKFPKCTIEKVTTSKGNMIVVTKSSQKIRKVQG